MIELTHDGFAFCLCLISYHIAFKPGYDICSISLRWHSKQLSCFLLVCVALLDMFMIVSLIVLLNNREATVPSMVFCRGRFPNITLHQHWDVAAPAKAAEMLAQKAKAIPLTPLPLEIEETPAA